MGGIELGSLVLGALAVAIAVYVWFVNRKRQVYRLERTVAAPISAVWEVNDFRPGAAEWIPYLQTCRWVDEAAGDMEFIYTTGAELRHRVVSREPETFLETEARMRPGPDAPWGDMMRTRTWFTALDDGRTHGRAEIEIEREPGFSGFGARLSYPWMLTYANRLVTKRLVEIGALAETPKKRGVGIAGQVVIVLVTLLWLAWLVGPWAGLGALGMLVVHEYGHVWSMRRNGHDTARFYLVPFFGGVAIGSRAFQSEREAVEIFLMGPVFGLLPSLALMGLFWVTDDPFYASLAGFLAIVNGLNLAPVPPLDGGRVMQSLLRPLGPKGWHVGSGLLIMAGAAIAAWYRLAGLLFIALLGALAWGMAPGPNAATRPLIAPGWIGAALAYAGLIALHVTVTVWALDLAGFDALEQGPAFLHTEDIY